MFVYCWMIIRCDNRPRAAVFIHCNVPKQVILNPHNLRSLVKNHHFYGKPFIRQFETFKRVSLSKWIFFHRSRFPMKQPRTDGRRGSFTTPTRVDIGRVSYLDQFACLPFSLTPDTLFYFIFLSNAYLFFFPSPYDSSRMIIITFRVKQQYKSKVI